MVHYFLAAPWWLRWDSPFAKTLQTLSTPAFSWQGTVIFKTGTFAQSCSLILSLGLYFTDTVILETAFAQSFSITLPLSCLVFSPCSSSFCPPLIHFSPSPPPCPPSSPTQAEHRRDNMQLFESRLCKVLAQPFVSFSIHHMHLRRCGELHSTASTTKKRCHAYKGATYTHSTIPERIKMQPKYTVNPCNDAMRDKKILEGH